MIGYIIMGLCFAIGWRIGHYIADIIEITLHKKLCGSDGTVSEVYKNYIHDRNLAKKGMSPNVTSKNKAYKKNNIGFKCEQS